jgi:hypothetical protein
MAKRKKHFGRSGRILIVQAGGFGMWKAFRRYPTGFQNL